MACLNQKTVADLSTFFLTSANEYAKCFCDNHAPFLDMPLLPGGPCTGGEFEGKITRLSGTPLENMVVTVFDANNIKRIYGSVVSGQDGSIMADRLVGDYKLLAHSGDECFSTIWFPGKNSFSEASIITLLDGMVLPVNFDLEERLIQGPGVTAPAAKQGIPVTYTFQRSDSAQKNPILYIVDWGDGTHDELSTNTVTKVWNTPGTYNAAVRTRCLDHQVESSPTSFGVDVPYPDTPELSVKFTKDVTQSCTNKKGVLNCTVKPGAVTVTNEGTAASTATTLNLYLSDDAIFGPSNTFLQQFKVKALKPGQILNLRTTNKRLPLGVTYAGKSYIAVVEFADRNQENNKAYNTIR